MRKVDPCRECSRPRSCRRALCDDVLDDRQSQPVPPDLARSREPCRRGKTARKSAAVLRFNADAVVGDLDARCRSRRRLRWKSSRVRGVLDRVLDEVGDGGLKIIGIAASLREIPVHAELNSCDFSAAAGCISSATFFSTPATSTGVLARAGWSFPDARVRAGPQRDSPALPRVAMRGREILRCLCAIVERAVEKRFHIPVNHAERRAQLVRNVRDKLAAKLLVSRRLGDVVKHNDEPRWPRGETADGHLEMLAVDGAEGDRLAAGSEGDLRDRLQDGGCLTTSQTSGRRRLRRNIEASCAVSFIRRTRC